MRRIAPAILLCLASATARAPAQEEGPVRAVLELNQQFYYAGEPFFVRISIANGSDSEVANPVGTPLFKGFQVSSTDGRSLEPEGEAEQPEPSRPAKIAPGRSYGAILDLTAIYPQLKEEGEYEIRWQANGIASDTIVVKMIPRYDPLRDYRARIETDEGTITIELLPDVSPIAVRNFVDLANVGFYDGLSFHQVRADRHVVAGDPTGTGSGGAGYGFPAELSRIPIVSGTVVMKPYSPSPPSNSSQFTVMLRPEPTWTGQVTVLGQVVEGLSVARKISSLPNSSAPLYRPLKDVSIRRIKVEEKPVPAAAAGGGNEGL